MTTQVETLESTQIIKRETSAEVLAAQAKALVNARYQVAMLKPRDWDDVRQKLLRDCERPRFAESATYAKPIGNSFVKGLSIRFAESAMRAMTNLQPEQVVLYDDSEQRIVRVSLTDIEANVSYSKDIVLQKTVERRKPRAGQTVLAERVNTSGQVVYIVRATEDELLTKEAALASKTLRQHALRLLPADIQEECVEKIANVVASHVKVDPQAEKKKIIDAFGEIGISVAELKKFLDTDSIDRLTPKQIVSLREVFQAIRDGETSWRDVMEQRDSVRGSEDTQSAGDPPVTQDQAREFSRAARQRLGTTQEAKDAIRKYMLDELHVSSSLRIPASRFDEAMKWARGESESPAAATSEPAVTDEGAKQRCFELFEILGYTPSQQAIAITDAKADYAAIAKKLEAELPEEQ